MTSFCLLVALAAQYDYHLHQMYVTIAFLHGDLSEEIYMVQPPLYIDSAHPTRVCRLHKALYGLKQSPRLWYFKFHQFMLHHGYHHLQTDPNVYTRHHMTSFLVIAIYVDDILILCDTLPSLLTAKTELMQAFAMTDGRELSYYLGIQVHRDHANGLIHLTQSKFVDEVLRRYHMHTCKGIDIPLATSVKLSSIMQPNTSMEIAHMKTLPYSSILGSVRYLVTYTRPDIYFTAGFLSRFMHSPGLPHWQAAKRLLRYLQHTKNYSLTFAHDAAFQPNLRGWSDADCWGDIDTCKSTAGYVFVFAGAAISWQSKKQHYVALSSTEAEYVATTLATKEGMWLKRMIAELGIHTSIPVTIYCDNQSCIALAKNPKHHEKTKHVDFKLHFLRDLIEEGCVTLVYAPTTKMWADFLTKATPKLKHAKCCRHIGLT